MGMDEDYWHTACGEDWIFPEGGPDENKMKFCPMCGRPLKVVRRAKT
jgi:rRNA maturation endonuclease Nob1